MPTNSFVFWVFKVVPELFNSRTERNDEIKIKFRGKKRREFNCVIHLNRLAGGVDLDDSLMMSKVETELTGVGCGALVAVDQFVTILARTFETAFHVGARLIAETPFLALVPICTKKTPEKHKEFRQYSQLNFEENI